MKIQKKKKLGGGGGGRWGGVEGGVRVDGVSPSVFRCTSTPMETGPIGACVET